MTDPIVKATERNRIIIEEAAARQKIRREVRRFALMFCAGFFSTLAIVAFIAGVLS